MRNALNWGNAQRARVVFAWRFPERRRAPQIAYKTVSFAHEDLEPCDHQVLVALVCPFLFEISEIGCYLEQRFAIRIFWFQLMLALSGCFIAEESRKRP